MSELIRQWLSDFRLFFFSLATFIGVWVVLYSVWRMASRRLKRLAAETESHWDDELVPLLNWPMQVLILVTSVRAATLIFPAEFRSHPVLVIGSQGAVVFLGAWMLQRILGLVIRYNTITERLSHEQRGLVVKFSNLLLYVLAVLVTLDSAGISITPILASLGVGSVAVALALQDTLGNIFAGIYILIDKPFRVGHFIRIDSNTEGFIDHIGWRSTRIRQPSNSLVIIPNSKVSSAVVINFNMPTPQVSLPIDASVSYDADLERVEKVTLEVATEILKSTDGAVADSDPVFRYLAFGDSAITFRVSLQITFIENGSLVRHQFIKALSKRFREEGIEIPFPQRVIHTAPSPAITRGV